MGTERQLVREGSGTSRATGRAATRKSAIVLAAVLLAGTGAVHASDGEPGDRGTHWKVPRLVVMPLGDSITYGVGSSDGSGYRGPLRNRLAKHAGTLDFVGSERSGRLPDPDNEGHPGWQIDDISTNIGTWLPAAKPNVVLLHIGTNDLAYDYGYGVDDAPGRLGELIDRITSAAPDMTVLVSTLVPAGDPRTRKRIDAFNAAVPTVVAERRRRGFHVGHVDMGRLTKQDLIDRLHPNDDGFAKMSDVFYDGIARAAVAGWIRQQVGVKPAPTPKVSPDNRRER